MKLENTWQEDRNFSWDQKKVIDRECRLIPRKIKEIIHSLKHPNHINKISYMLPDIWLPNFNQSIKIPVLPGSVFIRPFTKSMNL